MSFRKLHALFIALVALALSASLAFAAKPTGAGRPNVSSEPGVTVVGSEGADTATDEDADADEATEETETPDATESEQDTEAADSADNCAIDPTTVTPEELAAMSHGSVVCWAAHQTEWPAWFANHGAFVSCWAHQGKQGAPSCTEAPTTDAAAPTTHGKGKGKGKGRSNH